MFVGGYASWSLFEQCDDSAFVTFSTDTDATVTINWGGESANKILYCSGGGCDGTAVEVPHYDWDLHGLIEITTPDTVTTITITNGGCQ
jgi:hypothetical protein